MNSSDDLAVLRQTYMLCSTQRDALKDALQDIDQRELTAPDLENLSQQDRRLLGQFAYRYTRLQDDMGTRLFPSVLCALGENIPAMPKPDCRVSSGSSHRQRLSLFLRSSIIH